MARFWLLTGICLCLAVYTLSFDLGQITVFPKDHKKAGVFLVSYGSGGLNASQARDLCLFLDAAIATKAQVQTAMEHGLETCKFGWIDEDILALPRITKSPNCGRNNIGVVTSRATTSNRYLAYCFKSDVEQPLDTTTPPDTTAVTHMYKSTPKVPVFTKSTSRVWKTSLTTSTVPAPLKPTLSSSSTFTTPSLSSPHLPSSTVPPSRPLSASSLSFSRSAPPSGPSLSSVLSVSSNNLTVVPQPGGSRGVGAIATAFLVLVPILLLLAGAAAVRHFKMNGSIFPFWSAKRQKEEGETEMWRPSDSETDLRDQRTEGEEDTDRKYSSDITMRMSPDTKTNSP